MRHLEGFLFGNSDEALPGYEVKGGTCLLFSAFLSLKAFRLEMRKQIMGTSSERRETGECFWWLNVFPGGFMYLS